VSAVVVGPGLERADGDAVRAPRWARGFTYSVATYVIAAGTVAFLRANRVETVLRSGEAVAAIAMVVPAFCVAVAGLAIVVRGARLSVDQDGVRWGFAGWGFRMDRSRIGLVRLYRDAIALEPKKGFTWYLSARDWSPFTRLGDGVKRAQLPFADEDRRAPLIARLQSYGPTLDIILFIDVLAVTGVWLLL
jgi:hypothetical protein